ncbi:RNA polymerase sigma factor SigJ [Streptomyces sp. NPDC018031]|uniref:RNA polymerase sigma factor SigJ n=1 Tax=Streptomyces sp. NPDC018031 TaxID=3365033 RepID=UPI0037AD98E0
MAEPAEFEAHRGRLWAVAYRITGSVADADDAVQEAWLRWHALPDGAAEEPRAYLTTVVSRICYDQLSSARARRETYVGPWLPEPVLDGAGPVHAIGPAAPEDRVTLDESVGMALLAVLERLTPAERTAFILHDVFAVPFAEIAEVVGRTPEAVRQLASRARRHVRDEAPRRNVDRAEHRRAVDAFLSAVVGGDIEGLMRVLDPRVVWLADSGGKVRGAARRPVVGQDNVARLTRALGRRYTPGRTRLTVRDVNGAPGLVWVEPDGPRAGIIAFTLGDGGRITEIDVVVNPEKLRHLDLDEL